MNTLCFIDNLKPHSHSVAPSVKTGYKNKDYSKTMYHVHLTLPFDLTLNQTILWKKKKNPKLRLTGSILETSKNGY